MGDKSKIEWTDASWPVTVGCDHVSPGCDNCYAARLASGRLAHQPVYSGLAENGRFNGTVRCLAERLDWPLRWRRPRKIFVCSMSDLFHESVPDEFIARVFAVMASAQRHTFQVLTKRHARMCSLLSSPDFQAPVTQGAVALLRTGQPDFRALDVWPLPNVWCGVSAEDQHWAEIRVHALLRTPAAVRWVSAEPLLGPIDLRNPKARNGALIDALCGDVKTPAGEIYAACPGSVSWVVAGGESGAKARPMHPDWARRLRDDCQAADVPFFFKQWGEWSPLGPANRAFHSVADDGTVYAPGDLAWPDGPRWGEAVRACHDRAHLTAMYRVGKRAAGHELDGQVWQQFPSVAEAVSA